MYLLVSFPPVSVFNGTKSFKVSSLLLVDGKDVYPAIPELWGIRVQIVYIEHQLPLRITIQPTY